MLNGVMFVCVYVYVRTVRYAYTLKDKQTVEQINKLLFKKIKTTQKAVRA